MRVVLPVGAAGVKAMVGAVSEAVRPLVWTVARAAVTGAVKLLSGPPDRESVIVAVPEPVAVVKAMVGELEAMVKLPSVFPFSYRVWGRTWDPTSAPRLAAPKAHGPLFLQCESCMRTGIGLLGRPPLPPPWTALQVPAVAAHVRPPAFVL